MSNIRNTEYKKKQLGRYVWNVLQMERRKQKFRTVVKAKGLEEKRRSSCNLNLRSASLVAQCRLALRLEFDRRTEGTAQIQARTLEGRVVKGGRELLCAEHVVAQFHE